MGGANVVGSNMYVLDQLSDIVGYLNVFCYAASSFFPPFRNDVLSVNLCQSFSLILFTWAGIKNL